MLYFATRPDPIFTTIVDSALRYGQGVAADPERWGGCAHIRRFFSCHTGNWVLRDLRAAHRKPSAYQMSDFHWILVHAFLRDFCEQHNHLIRAADGSSLTAKAVGDFQVGPIVFWALVARFFWDLESFPWVPKPTPTLSRTMRGITDRREKVQSGQPPEFADLRLTLVRWPQWQPALPTIAATIEIPVYPPETADYNSLPNTVVLRNMATTTTDRPLDGFRR